MVKGLLLLFAPSILEARIITSFLEAAEYQVVDFLALPSDDHSGNPLPFDAAVLVLDNEDTDLAAQLGLLRETARREQLPIVAVVTQNSSPPAEALRVLLRPIRLFDLVHAVDQAVADSRRESSTDSRNLHNERA